MDKIDLKDIVTDVISDMSLEQNDTSNRQVEHTEKQDEIENKSEVVSVEKNIQDVNEPKTDINKQWKDKKITQNLFENTDITVPDSQEVQAAKNDEIKFLKSLKGKLLILFGGLKSPNIEQKDEKLNMVINFLQYELALLEDRIDDISK